MAGGAGTTWSQAGTVNNWYEVGAGSNPVNYNGGTTDTVTFGSSSTPIGSSTYTVTINGTVNAGTIDFNNYSTSGTSLVTHGTYVLSGGTINSSGAVVIAGGGADDSISGVTFTGGSSYQFTGTTLGPNLGNGFIVSSTDSFGSNVTFGTGSDYGVVSAGTTKQLTTSTSGTVTLNAGWEYTIGGGAKLELVTQNFVLNGLGSGANGTLNMGGSSHSGQGFDGTILLASDSAIVSGVGNGNNTGNYGSIQYVTSNISGSGNLYLGMNGKAYVNSTQAPVQEFVIGGTHLTGTQTIPTPVTDSTNTGAVIVFNTTTIGDNPAANGGVSAERVVLGQNNGLSTASYLILGQTGSYKETNSVGAPNSQPGNVTWVASDGAFDLGGYNQSLQGIVVGGVKQNSGVDVLLQGNNVIFNDSGAGTSLLTITGTTGNAVSTGFGGVIEDNNGTLTGGKVAVEVNGGTLQLAGQNTYSGGTTVDNNGLLEVGTSSNSTTTENSNITGTFGSTSGTLAVNTGGTVDLEGASETVGATTLGTTSVATNQGGTITSSTAGGVLTTAGVTVNGTGNVIGTNATVLGGSTGVNVSSGAALKVNGSVDNLNVAGSASGTGNVTSLLTIQSGGIVTPGNGISTALAASNVNFTSGGELSYTLSSSSVATNVLNISGIFTVGTGIYNIALSGGDSSLQVGSQYVLVTFGSISGYSSIGTDFNLINNSVYNNGGETGILEIVGNELVFDITAVPEPGTWVMLLGGLVVLGFCQRRKLAAIARRN